MQSTSLSPRTHGVGTLFNVISAALLLVLGALIIPRARGLVVPMEQRAARNGAVKLATADEDDMYADEAPEGGTRGDNGADGDAEVEEEQRRRDDREEEEASQPSQRTRPTGFASTMALALDD